MPEATAPSSPSANAPSDRLDAPAPPIVELTEALHRSWRIAGPEALSGLSARRLLYLVRRGLARLLRPQETFNAAVVQYVTASTTLHHAAAEQAVAIDHCREAIAEQAVAIDHCREAITEQAVAIDHCREAIAEQTRLLSEIRHWRKEIQVSVGVLHRAQQTQTKGRSRSSRRSTVPHPEPHTLHSHKYVGFEDQFRGRPEDIRERVAEYVPLFEESSDVLDIGCGRGEFLEVLRQHGIPARGIDINETMVDICRSQELDVVTADALAYVSDVPDGSLGGIFAAQVIEHFEPQYLIQLIEVAVGKLRPGAPIVLETINPACWFAFFSSYIRDFTHVRPIHPDTLKYLLIACGFQHVDLMFRAPYPNEEKLQPVPAGSSASGLETFTEWAGVLNANADKINHLLFGWLDYAAIGYRP